VYRGSDGAFNLYEDENDGYGYEEGRFSVIPIQWDEANQILTLGARQGSFPGMLKHRTFQIIWVSEGRGNGMATTATPDHTVTYDGEGVRIHAS
jgi:alpha-D-xyloside xylohydrolase